MDKITAWLHSVCKGLLGKDPETEALEQRVEHLQEQVEDISHDLHVSRQRSDTLYKLVQSMREPENVQR